MLLPILREIKADLNRLNELYDNLSDIVRNLEKHEKFDATEIQGLVNASLTWQLNLKLASVNTSLRQELKSIETQLESHVSNQLAVLNWANTLSHWELTKAQVSVNSSITGGIKNISDHLTNGITC